MEMLEKYESPIKTSAPIVPTEQLFLYLSFSPRLKSFINIEEKGDKHESEEVNIDLYGMVKQCIIEGRDLPDYLQQLLGLNENLSEDKKLQIVKRTRANSMI